MNKREERAFEALFVSEMQKADQEDFDFEKPVTLSDKEERALNLLGPDFMEQMLAGTRPIDCDENEPVKPYVESSAAAEAALYRADDVDEATAEELKAKEREIIQRKRRKREQDDESA